MADGNSNPAPPLTESTPLVDNSPECSTVRGVAVTVSEPTPPHRTRKEIAEAIFARIIGGERLHVACRAEGTAWQTLWEWKAADPDLAVGYARAREGSADSWEDRSTEFAELSENYSLRENNARWRAKVANPKAYGEKVDLTSAGARIGLEELVAGSMEKRPGVTSGA